MLRYIFLANFLLITCLIGQVNAQVTIQGKVVDATTGDPVIGANVAIPGSTSGTVTSIVGEYKLTIDTIFPITLHFSYVGYQLQSIEVSDERTILIQLQESVLLDSVVVRGSGVLERNQRSQKTITSFERTEMLSSPSLGLFPGISRGKDIDLITPSIICPMINTRGFNSTSPVRMLQLIDGVDNQSPGLNFSLGNFLGASELDLLRVEVIVGASSPFYGPNAFNGVISMQTLDPFIHTGLTAMVRGGERQLFEFGMRYADIIRNKNGDPTFAYKFNFYGIRANDWKAENYNPITDSRVPENNPGRYDAVNIYGDEYYGRMDLTQNPGHKFTYPGLGSFYRTGYKETDLVDYDSYNIKSNLSLQYRFKPNLDIYSPELMLTTAMGAGTTVYQGDNRFSLREILFFQHKIEFRKRDHYFLRAYFTHEDAGKSYDPYFTALRLQQLSKDNDTWTNDYIGYWNGKFPSMMRMMGYPSWKPGEDPPFDIDSAMTWLMLNQVKLTGWHGETADYTDTKNTRNPPWMRDFLEPGTPEFDTAFNDITSRFNNDESGTRFYDKSALFHVHGEYKWAPKFFNEITLGGNYRLYLPDSKGTIFHDTAGTTITNSEIGVYAGIRKGLLKDQRLMADVTLRVDKNQNFKWINTTAISLVYQLIKDSYLRASYSSALRNPTLSDQYLYLNVGPAILAGHIDPIYDLISLSSFNEGRDSFNFDNLEYINIPALKPERVYTFEFGMRNIIRKDLFTDISYYQSTYTDFLGYVIGITSDFNPDPIFPAPYNTQVYRYSANSEHIVKTEGWSVGLTYDISSYVSLSGNYSYNILRKTVEDDPIIPAFNTPKHKYNLGVTVHSNDLFQKKGLRTIGFGVNYKWVDSYLFEGSPQFTGEVPAYGLVDAQVNMKIIKWNTTVKIGASNILDHKHYETYGGPTVGRLAYVQARYNF